MGTWWTRNWPVAASDGAPASYLAELSEERHPTARPSMATRLLPISAAKTTGFASRLGSNPYPENNTVHGLWFRASRPKGRAVIVLPHWNAQLQQHIALCRVLQTLGISALRLSLPYHDLRMPSELTRADYAVSSNVARTVDATRQAIIDTRSAVDWLQSLGYDRLGIVGTSLGSCYAFLTSAHDARLRVNVFNLFSLHFADVVWTGLTTRHIRQGFEGQIELEQLRACWKAITPASYMDHFAENQSSRCSSTVPVTRPSCPYFPKRCSARRADDRSTTKLWFSPAGTIHWGRARSNSSMPIISARFCSDRCEPAGPARSLSSQAISDLCIINVPDVLVGGNIRWFTFIIH